MNKIQPDLIDYQKRTWFYKKNIQKLETNIKELEEIRVMYQKEDKDITKISSFIQEAQNLQQQQIFLYKKWTEIKNKHTLYTA